MKEIRIDEFKMQKLLKEVEIYKQTLQEIKEELNQLEEELGTDLESESDNQK